MTHAAPPARKLEALRQRARIIAAIRHMFASADFLEVETPLRIPAPAPELHIDPTPSGDAFLIASPELQMKRLMAAGCDRIFQICHCFRDGERGPRHLPEFTMLEWYRAGGTLADLMDDCRAIVTAGACAVGSPETITRQGTLIHLNDEWPVLEVQDTFERLADWRPGADPDPLRFDMDLVDRVEPALPADRPCFLAGYPAAMASLARLDNDNPERALRMELYAGGLELANGYEELTDARLQRERFIAEEARRRAAEKPPFPMDEAFFKALETGLPPCAGMAMGLDRLVMLLTDLPTINDVVAFSFLSGESHDPL